MKYTPLKKSKSNCKKQHHIPCFYLKNFSYVDSNKSRDYTISKFRKLSIDQCTYIGDCKINTLELSSKQFNCNLRLVDNEYFFTMRDEGNEVTYDDYLTEDLEPFIETVLTEIVSQESMPDMNDYKKNSLLYFFIAQRYKSSELNDIVSYYYDECMKYPNLKKKLDTLLPKRKIINTMKCIILYNAFQEWCNNNINIQRKGFESNNIRFGILKTYEDRNFIIGDNPIIMYDTSNNYRDVSKGISLSESFLMVAPVSDTLSIVIENKNFCELGNKNTRDKYFSVLENSLLHKNKYIVDRYVVDIINRFQYDNAKNFIYTNNIQEVNYTSQRPSMYNEGYAFMMPPLNEQDCCNYIQKFMSNHDANNLFPLNDHNVTKLFRVV